MELVEKYFDIALSSPDGIKKLRAMILTLAMQGKLTKQNTNDSSEELLKSIFAERKKLKNEASKDATAPFVDSDILVLIPSNWKWIRFGQIAAHNAGKTLDSGRNKGQLRKYITTSNLYWDRFELSDLKEMPIGEDELEKCSARRGDLLIIEGGDAGRAAVWPYDEAVCFQNHIHRARFFCGVEPQFVCRYFEKLSMTGEINKFRKGVAITSLSGKSLTQIPIPIPPVKEQREILQKITVLMSRCDELERLRKVKETKHFSVNTVALNALLKSNNEKEFLSSWQFIENNFSELYSVKENVAELRKSILQLAVMGKLVPQDPKEKPALESLREIQAEREKLINSGKLKKQNLLSPITDKEIPFQIPKGWEWVRLGDIGLSNIGLTYKPSDVSEKGVPVLRSNNIQRGLLDLSDLKRVDLKVKDSVLVQNGDLLICARNGSRALVGKTARIKEINEPMAFGAFMAIFRSEFNHYLLYFINSPLFRKVIDEVNTMTINQITQENLKNTLCPLPPKQEQQRIIEKIEVLFGLCKVLEEKVTESERLRTSLLDAILLQGTL